MSAESTGKVTFVFDGTHTPAQWRDLTDHWRRMVSFQREDGRVEFIGYLYGDTYTYGESVKSMDVVDLWGLIARRGSWDHSASSIADWSLLVTGNRAWHAGEALVRAREVGPPSPKMIFPTDIPGQSGGFVFERPYYGYFLEYVTDVWDDLMKEGIDIYMSPERQGTYIGDAGYHGVQWRFFAGEAWGTGRVHEYVMGVPDSPISVFRQRRDSARVANRTIWAGEGSERDMLIRTAVDTSSPLPLLERVVMSKNTSVGSQLSSMAAQDLAMHRSPTVEWSFDVHWASAPDVGDKCRFFFDRHFEIPDGWHERRVVRVSGDLGEMVTVTVQPVGGA